VHQTAWLLLGTNLGKRLENLQAATGAIRTFLGSVELQSHIYETAAWGRTHQPDYYNQAIRINTPCSALETLHQIKQIEYLLGRKHDERWSPRVIDIDILFFDDHAITSPLLTIPHAYLAERRFALEPLNEIAPDLMHPVLGITVADMLAKCQDTSKINLLEESYHF
jgi:2-amino-4-hydroxy-6-hydroxymethyldihydropteridine diphosphokinase